MAEDAFGMTGRAVQRQQEREKYERAYLQQNYRMGDNRMAFARADLEALPVRGSYLDVACGRGEMLDYGRSVGFDVVHGTEIVSSLLGSSVSFAEVHALPFMDNEFEVVSMFDVIEHLIVGDDELACRELMRVASRHILITANNLPSSNGRGEELHINRRPYEEWDALFYAWFEGAEVTWLQGRDSVSETWRIDLSAEAIAA